MNDIILKKICKRYFVIFQWLEKYLVVRVPAQQRLTARQLLPRPDTKILRSFPVVPATTTVYVVREFSVYGSVAYRPTERTTCHGSQVGIPEDNYFARIVKTNVKELC